MKIRNLLLMMLAVGICVQTAEGQLATQMQSAIARQARGIMRQVVPSTQESAPLNWQTKTMGGKQFWSDVHHVGGWRIQQHALTDHYRLLSPDDVRFAWGQWRHCHRELNRQIENGVVPRNQEKVIVLLHGLVGTRSKMSELEKQLSATGDFQVINVAYSSTQKTIAENARSFHRLILGLGDEVREIHLVAHSLGCLVVRRYLHDQADPKTGGHGDERIRRMVMLGPPNQGSAVARLFQDNLLFQSLAGVGGQELSTHWQSVKKDLAIPAFEFGIIAGAQASSGDFSNLLLRGRDDFTVSLAETRLAGAVDTFEWPILHHQLVSHPKAIEATERFIRFGYFDTPQKKPISR